MKCKLAAKTRGCFLKACTKRKSGCPYNECSPDDIPLTLLNGLFQRRYDARIHYWRVIGENPASSYDAGFKAGLNSARVASTSFPEGYNHDQEGVSAHLCCGMIFLINGNFESYKMRKN